MRCDSWTYLEEILSKERALMANILTSKFMGLSALLCYLQTLTWNFSTSAEHFKGLSHVLIICECCTNGDALKLHEGLPRSHRNSLSSPINVCICVYTYITMCSTRIMYSFAVPVPNKSN